MFSSYRSKIDMYKEISFEVLLTTNIKRAVSKMFLLTK